MFLEACLKYSACFPDIGTTTRIIYTVYYTFHLLRDWLVLYLHQYAFKGSLCLKSYLKMRFLVDLSIFSLMPLTYGEQGISCLFLLEWTCLMLLVVVLSCEGIVS